MSAHELPSDDLPVGAVRRAGPWAVAHPPEGPQAVSRRCRHQLADLSQGTLDRDGCLVCPWHGSRYDLGTGAMVQGPRGFLWYVGRVPGYDQLIRVTTGALRLRRARVTRRGPSFVVEG